MSREALHFEELRVRRMPGFEQEGFRLRELSPGVNVVFGPNGSGKSTVARALSRLLWPTSGVGGERVSLVGRFQLAEVAWSVDLEGARAIYLRDGIETPPPALPSGEDHHRYRLSLHDLLHERDVSFARTIARESAGGYDVRAAGAVLDPRDPPRRRSAATEELERARAAYREAEAGQRELREEELRLAELRARRSAADEALQRAAVLEIALEHARTRETEVQTRAELERFPDGVARVGGDEYERLCTLREQGRRIGEEIVRAREAAAAARTTVEEAALPAPALGEEVLRGLQEDLAALKEAEQEAVRAARARAAAEARLAEERGRIGGAVQEDRLAGLAAGELGSLVAFARRAGEVTAARQALEAEVRLLAPREGEEEIAADRLLDGARLLQRWLRQPAPAAPAAEGNADRAAGLIAAGLLVLLGLLAGVLLQPLYLLVALVGAVLLWPLLGRRAAPEGVVDAREVHRADFDRLDLESPDGWEVEEVERLLERLQQRAMLARTNAERARRRRELEERLAAAADEEREIEREREAMALQLGVEPERSAAELAWLAEAVGRWQAAHAARTAEVRAQQDADARMARLGEVLRGKLEPLGFQALSSTGELAGAIHAFAQRRQALELGRQALAAAERDLRRLEEARAEREAERQALFAALGLDPDADETVRDWCQQHAAFVKAREHHREAMLAARNALARLRSREADESLYQATVYDLEAELVEARAEGAERDGLAHEISSTEALVDRAKRSHSIEEALERIGKAEFALQQARERDLRGAVAGELIAYLEAATRDQHLPAVFRRARGIFARITHGRYELRLRQQGDPEFSAFDNLDRRDRTLDELSSGTRLQLLIAVRVAFVEEQEQGLMLPLVLDEVLGNSDDERARAIIEAALELARQGRQIFYFTAQADEVARWRALAAGAQGKVALREIDLPRERGWDRVLEIPATVPAVRPEVPAPEGQDHAAYGRSLRVPRLDRATIEPAAVHLWYLVEDPVELHRLLLLGPDRWGPFAALARNGGRPLVRAETMRELEVCARALEAFCEAARVGVGVPVDRGVLEESGAVSNTFLDRVNDLARSLRGDGAELMQALEAGRVPRFGRASKEGLRAHLEDAGALPQEAPLTAAKIRLRVLSRVTPELDRGEIPPGRIERLVDRLWMGVEGGREADLPVS